MTEAGDLFQNFVEIASRANYEGALKKGLMPSNMPQDWEQVNPLIKHSAMEHMTTILAAAWPLVSVALDQKETQGIEQAAVLRGRVEMFISELQGRGKGVIAAELQIIIDAPMED